MSPSPALLSAEAKQTAIASECPHRIKPRRGQRWRRTEQEHRCDGLLLGMGAVTPVAAGVEASWSRLLAGRSGIRRLPDDVVGDLPAKIGGAVPAFLNPSGPAADERTRYFEIQSSTKKGATSMNKTNLGVALVTGASTGIGHATAKALQNAGFRVFGTSRRPAAERSDGVTMRTCDVTDDASVAKLVDDVLAEAGRI